MFTLIFNPALFQQICGLNDIDIISIVPESRPPYRLSRKLYNMAVDKNIFFEIPYGSAIVDATCRKNIIAIAHQYFTIGKSKVITFIIEYLYFFSS